LLVIIYNVLIIILNIFFCYTTDELLFLIISELLNDAFTQPSSVLLLLSRLPVEPTSRCEPSFRRRSCWSSPSDGSERSWILKSKKHSILNNNQPILNRKFVSYCVVTLSDRRNTRLSFVRTNRFKVGLNSIHNRLRSISNVLDKNWINKSAEDFKLNCKIRIIQNSLMLL